MRKPDGSGSKRSDQRDRSGQGWKVFAKATLHDLNDKVLAWIRNEHLEKKIRISFMKAKQNAVR